MNKISSKTSLTLFDKKLTDLEETQIDEKDFVERVGPVDLLLNECLNPSKSEVIHHVCTDAGPLDDLDEEADRFVEKLMSETTPLDTKSALSMTNLPKSSHTDKIQVGMLIADRYEVKEYIGEGAFGEVYRGYHNLLKIDIAIKALKRRSAYKQQVVKRFIREAQIMANIHHPNVIRIYDVGEVNGQVYLVMKYIAGMNLEDFINQEEGQTLSKTVELMIQIAEALAIIHSQGIIHRDIKPLNIMIDSDGKPILMDFGIAKAGDTTNIDHKNLTVEGHILGTPSYMAPEQFKTSDKITKATDVYALGVTFYQMVTGRLPFSGDSFLEVYESHKTIQPPPTHTLSKSASARISKVISKMLEKDPSRRYPDGASVKEALQRAGRSRFKAAITIAGILAVVTLIVFAVVRTKMITKEETEKAQLHIANSLITKGTGLTLARDWKNARSKFTQAFKLYRKLRKPTIIAELGLWEVQRHSPPVVNSFTGHSSPPLCMAMSPQGRLGLSGSADGELIVWHLPMGRALKSFVNSVDAVPKTSVAFSSDSKYALSSNFHGQIVLWDVDTGEQIQSFNDHGGWVHKVIFSPDGTMALSGHEEGSVILWNVLTGEKNHTFRIHTSSVRCLAFSEGGQWIVSGGADELVALWNVQTGNLERTFTGHKDEVTSVAFSSDSQSIISGSNDGAIKVWNMESGEAINTYNGSESAVLTVAFLPGSTSVVAGQYDSTITQWDLNYERPINRLSGYVDAFTSAALSPTGKLVLGATENNRFHIFSAEIQREVTTFVGHISSVRSVNLAQNGMMAISGAWDGTVIVWDSATGYPVRTLQGHKRAVTGVEFTSNNTKVVSASLDGTIALWSLHSGRTIRTFASKHGPIEAIDITPNENLIISGHRSGDVVLWDLKTGEPLHEFQPFASPIISVAFSITGHFVSAGSKQGKLIIWDMASFDRLQEFEIPLLSTAKFTHNDQMVVCGSTNGTYTLLDVEGGQNSLKTIGDETEGINTIEVIPDGLYGLSGSQKPLIRIWELENGRELFALKGHKEGVTSLVYSRSGKKLISGSKDKTVKLWNFSRLSQYSEFEVSLRSALEQLKANPHDPEALNLLGEWYYFRGIWDWAIMLISNAGNQGLSVSSLTLARCYWHTGDLKRAYDEFHKTLGTGEAADTYLQLCMTAVEEQARAQDAGE